MIALPQGTRLVIKFPLKHPRNDTSVTSGSKRTHIEIPVDGRLEPCPTRQTLGDTAVPARNPKLGVGRDGARHVGASEEISLRREEGKCRAYDGVGGCPAELVRERRNIRSSDGFGDRYDLMTTQGQE